MASSTFLTRSSELVSFISSSLETSPSWEQASMRSSPCDRFRKSNSSGYEEVFWRKSDLQSITSDWHIGPPDSLPAFSRVGERHHSSPSTELVQHSIEPHLSPAQPRTTPSTIQRPNNTQPPTMPSQATTTIPDDASPPPGYVPSSMGDEFFEESRAQKLFRKIKQEPLVPLGCLATCYALYQASKSIRVGNPTRTNKMFRARIYAQGFTLAAIVAGSFFYKDERMNRKVFEEKVEEKKALEKREKWLRELEARDQEEREWRERIERKSREQGPGMKAVDVKGKVEEQFAAKSVREGMRRAWWVERTWEVWRRA
jgi:hypothetical protein